MLKKVALGVVATLAVSVAGVLAFAATKPDTFRVARTTTIQAPAEAVFAHVEDFHKWQAWSPFEKLDPAMKRTFSGAARGEGAKYAWSGNDHAGSGSMEILEAVPGRKLTIKLDFTKPFESHNTAEYTMVPKGDVTEVTWAMSGPQPYITKVMCVFMDMDAMIGQEFETGLATLKALSEKKAT